MHLTARTAQVCIGRVESGTILSDSPAAIRDVLFEPVWAGGTFVGSCRVGLASSGGLLHTTSVVGACDGEQERGGAVGTFVVSGVPVVAVLGSAHIAVSSSGSVDCVSLGAGSALHIGGVSGLAVVGGESRTSGGSVELVPVAFLTGIIRGALLETACSIVGLAFFGSAVQIFSSSAGEALISINFLSGALDTVRFGSDII